MDKPIIFISYSRKDIEFVRRRAGDLEQAGYAPWWDIADLRRGQVWAAEIDKYVRVRGARLCRLTKTDLGYRYEELLRESLTTYGNTLCCGRSPCPC